MEEIGLDGRLESMEGWRDEIARTKSPERIEDDGNSKIIEHGIYYPVKSKPRGKSPPLQNQLVPGRSCDGTRIEDKELEITVLDDTTKTLKRKNLLPELSMEVIVRHRAMLNQLGELEILAEKQFALHEVEKPGIPGGPLHLYLLRRIRSDQQRPMMPCANQAFLQDNLENRHGYEEPIRDRDKNWREALWTKIVPKLKHQGPQNLDRYDENELFRSHLFLHGLEEEEHALAKDDRLCKVFVDGVLMNKMQILREGLRFGEKPMIVTVYGMGIAGRVYMENHKNPRHLLVEAHSPLDLSHYELRVDIDQLVELFEGSSRRLLDPGHKRELCTQIVRMIWLDEREDRLKIGPGVKIGSALLRRKTRERIRKQQEAESRIAQQALENERALQLARGGPHTWPRNQGLVYRTCKTIDKHSLILSMYNHVKRRTAFVVELYDPRTSQRYSMSVGARELNRLTQMRGSPELWEQNEKVQACKKLVDHVSLQTEGEHTSVMVGSRHGIQGKSLRKLTRDSRRRAMVPGETPQELAAQIVRLQSLAGSMRFQAQTGRESFHDLRSRRRVAVFSLKTPARHMGKGKLLVQGACRITSVLFVYTCYDIGQETLRFFLYCPATTRTDMEEITRDDYLAYLKEAVEEGKNHSKHEISLLLLRKRFCIENLGLVRNVCVNRCIYKRGHKIYERRKSHGPGKLGFVYCYVQVFQHLERIWFRVFEPVNCTELEFELPRDEVVEMLKDFERMTALERDIQIGVHASMLVLEYNDCDSKAALKIMDVEEQLRVASSTDDDDDDDE